MMILEQMKHISALASHYDKEAEHYDAFNEAGSAQTNQVIEEILQKHGVKTVLDLTCGTGSQVFFLAKRGYEIIGVDINNEMLEIARGKAKKQNLSICLEQGDMRTEKVGKFDAVITIFNSIGHLTQQDFEIAIQNIGSNLNPNGLYIFDIFNLDHLLQENNITKLTIDWQKKSGDVTVREIQYSTITQDGVLTSYDIYHKQIGSSKPIVTTAFQTLQVYSAPQLCDILQKNGFTVIRQSGIDGAALSPQETERILTVAEKL